MSVLESLTAWMVSSPKVSIIVFAFVVTFIMTLITKWITDQTRMKELKAKQKENQKKIKEMTKNGDKEGIDELQKEILSGSMELMKLSFKPMFYTIIPLLIFFWWLRGVYDEVLAGWIWWYIGGGVASSIILRKVLNVA